MLEVSLGKMVKLQIAPGGSSAGVWMVIASDEQVAPCMVPPVRERVNAVRLPYVTLRWVQGSV